MSILREVSIASIISLVEGISKSLINDFNNKIILTNEQINELVKQYKIYIPSSTSDSDYGFLFTVVKSDSGLIFLPIGYGANPSEAIINRWAAKEKFPNLYVEIEKDNLSRLQSIGGGSIDDKAIWLKYNKYNEMWTSSTISFNNANNSAVYRMQGINSAYNLTKNTIGIERLRNQSLFYSSLYQNYKNLLIANKIDVEIKQLIDANEKMTRLIESSLEEYRRISSLQNFFNTCSFVLNLISTGASIYNANTPVSENMEYQKKTSYNEVLHYGGKVVQVNGEIIQKLSPIITNKDIPDKIDYNDDIVNLLD